MKSLEFHDVVAQLLDPVQSHPTIWSEAAGRPAIAWAADHHAAEQAVGAPVAWRTVLKRAAQVWPPAQVRDRPAVVGIVRGRQISACFQPMRVRDGW
jgi:hypothetical protein